MEYLSGVLRFSVNNNGSVSYSEHHVPPGWHHWAGVADAISVRLYMDGELVGAPGIGIISGLSENRNSVIDIGKGINSSVGSSMKGKIDEIRIWNVARTQQQLKTSMNNILTLPQSGLVSYYNFESGISDHPNPDVHTLINIGNSSSHGTLQNFALNGGPLSNWVESYAMVIPVIFPPTNITATGFTANWKPPLIGSYSTFVFDVSTDSSFASFLPGYASIHLSEFSKDLTGLNDSTTYYYRIKTLKNFIFQEGSYSSAIKASLLNSCPNQVLRYSSSIIGNNYQWQVYTGNEFVNILNDSIYSGATSRYLEINGATEGMYGYKFRCLVNGMYSDTVELKFRNFWKGIINNDWSNPANWSCGIVPNRFTDVYIHAQTVNNPVIIAGDYECASLTTTVPVSVSTGANLKILRGSNF